MASLRAIVHGRVQGVFFRDFVRKQASMLGLTGYVRNLSDGNSLEVLAEGDTEKLNKLQDKLKVGPPYAQVVRLDANRGEYSGAFSDFKIKR